MLNENISWCYSKTCISTFVFEIPSYFFQHFITTSILEVNALLTQ